MKHCVSSGDARNIHPRNCCSLSSFLLFKCITTFVSCATFRISARRSALSAVLSSPMTRHGTSCWAWSQAVGWLKVGLNGEQDFGHGFWVAMLKFCYSSYSSINQVILIALIALILGGLEFGWDLGVKSGYALRMTCLWSSWVDSVVMILWWVWWVLMVVGGWATPLKNMNSSIGMIRNPILMGK